LNIIYAILFDLFEMITRTVSCLLLYCLTGVDMGFPKEKVMQYFLEKIGIVI